MDMTNAARIRCFRTPQRTVLAFGQWSDLGEADLPDLIRGVFRSIEDREELMACAGSARACSRAYRRILAPA